MTPARGRAGSLSQWIAPRCPNLLEAELFGYEKGAFTGAIRSKPGLMEAADRGTLFLDEVGEIPIALQGKLLRAIQEKEHRRVGGTETIKFDIRVLWRPVATCISRSKKESSARIFSSTECHSDSAACAARAKWRRADAGGALPAKV